MKLRTVALWASLGVAASSAAALAVPLPRASRAPAAKRTAVADPPAAHVTAGQTLALDARLGHAAIARTGSGETYLFASVTGGDGAGVSAPPLDLAIVVDRSGSMKGDRIADAIAAAVGVVDRMRDGDSVAVVSFDTEPTVVVPPTITTAATRSSIQAAIRAIRLGGDTCISCGLEEGMRQLERASLGPERVSRMILLSDGATNHGVRDLGGLRAMAGRMQGRGVSVSTIGVDVDFDERVMAAIASESNGRHYFVASPAALPAVFSQEFDALLASVASDAELRIELSPGVEVEQVFDRGFRREGSRLVVPFGTFAAKQEKTVLVKLRVPAERAGREPVADVTLAYRDLASKSDASCAGSLALDVTDDPDANAGLDPFVAARVERSRTAQTLTDVNALFEQGRLAEARDKLKEREESLARTRSAGHAALAARPVAPQPAFARGFDDDLDVQRRAVAEAEATFAAPPPDAVASGGGPFAVPPASAPKVDSREGKAVRKENQQNAADLAF